MKTKTIIIIISILLLLSLSYIAYKEFRDYSLRQRVVFYNQGYAEGTLYWNDVVVNNVNAGKIPYILNNTIHYLPIKQICENVK
jgi:hypothetical protein